MKPQEALRKGSEALGLRLTDRMSEALLIYMAELTRWNKKTNLTSIEKPEDIIIAHFLDSLAFLKAFTLKEGTIADIGTGAGFPGIPLKIYLGSISLTLIESSSKKASFLHHIIGLLGLDDVKIVNNRIEELDPLSDPSIMSDIIVARAFAKLDRLVKSSLPILRPGGRIIAGKGWDIDNEISRLLVL
ncbi:MAG TPA: 16S rRNA (guanine(527)-N(7))-methyltransferase RsmG, partial [Nitrospiria bacterium]|nr:16S rRNA (guanine(527)-N(7))-methyltransferase RsmG [Nitrospiria bacterium]